MLGTRKIAIFLLTLRGEISGGVFKQFSESEQEKILVEIASPTPISPDDRSQVMDEFMTKMQLQGIYSTGGMAEAEQLLQSAFGSKRAARDMTSRLSQVLEQQPFSMFRDAEPGEIYSFLSTESPQTIALVLSHLLPDQAAQVMSQFPQRKRNQIASRIAMMAPMSPDAVEEVETTLKERYVSTSGRGQKTSDGPQILAKVLTKAQREITDTVLESIDNTDPETAQKIRESMFTFEDIVLIDDLAIRNEVMRASSIATHLPRALKGASEEVQDKFLRNMTEVRKNRLQSQIGDLGQMRLREVEEAQRAILEDIRRLEDSGKIVISREEEEFVG